MRTVVLDTNVLLSDPEAITAFPGAEVVIPETVLGELDKIKTSRVDADLRYKGREASRLLFELSEQGPLLKGVDLDNGGKLRVVPFESDMEMPEGLSSRNADDRILAVAANMRNYGVEDLTVVTNDLNMLLKAQALGIEVERRANDFDGQFTKRFIVRPFQKYKVPIGILAVAIAVFAASIVLALYGRGLFGPASAGLPTEFKQVLSPAQQKIYDLTAQLQSNPEDTQSQRDLADTYYDLMTTSRNPSDTHVYANLALKHYQIYLASDPGNNDVRTDTASVYFYIGSVDRAIEETKLVLKDDPNHIQANFNLGIFYWRGRKDYAAAARQMQKVIALTSNGDAAAQSIGRGAQDRLNQIAKEAAAAGKPIPGIEVTTSPTPQGGPS